MTSDCLRRDGHELVDKGAHPSTLNDSPTGLSSGIGSDIVLIRKNTGWLASRLGIPSKIAVPVDTGLVARV
jgi:hypothetical protein